MQHPINPTLHGVIDYSTVLSTAAAPQILDMPDSAASACYALAGGFTGLSMLNDFRLGVKRVMPFQAHGLVDAISALALPALPWLLGFSKKRQARNFFLGLAAVTTVVAVLTDWQGERGATKRMPARVRRVLDRMPGDEPVAGRVA